MAERSTLFRVCPAGCVSMMNSVSAMSSSCFHHDRCRPSPLETNGTAGVRLGRGIGHGLQSPGPRTRYAGEGPEGRGLRKDKSAFSIAEAQTNDARLRIPVGGRRLFNSSGTFPVPGVSSAVPTRALALRPCYLQLRALLFHREPPSPGLLSLGLKHLWTQGYRRRHLV